MYHPDNGGDEETMKEINRQYDDAFARISHENKSDGESTAYDDKAENEAFKAVINDIIPILPVNAADTGQTVTCHIRCLDSR